MYKNTNAIKEEWTRMKWGKYRKQGKIAQAACINSMFALTHALSWDVKGQIVN